MGCLRFKSKGKTIDIESAVIERKLLSKRMFETQMHTRESVTRLERLVFAVWERVCQGNHGSCEDGVFSDSGVHSDECAVESRKRQTFASLFMNGESRHLMSIIFPMYLSVGSKRGRTPKAMQPNGTISVRVAEDHW